MEEKLRNLSQNIAANTGDDHKPKKHESGEEKPWEEHEAPEEEPREEEHHEEDHQEEPQEEVPEEPQEEVSDYTPEPEEQSEEEQPEEEHAEEEPKEEEKTEGSEEEPKEEKAEDSEEHTEEKSEDEPKKIEVEEASEPESEESKPEEKEPEGPKILSMEAEEEPTESPTRTKKYSPEVEAALSRLNEENASVDLSEPLSTEPKKKGHGARIFLFILFLLAIAAVTLCILVEQKIIDNPFPNLFRKEEPAQAAPADDGTAGKVSAKTYLDVPEWGIKVEQPTNYTYALNYSFLSENELQINLISGSETVGSLHIKRDLESATGNHVTAISGYYYFTNLTGSTKGLEGFITNEQIILAL